MSEIDVYFIDAHNGAIRKSPGDCVGGVAWIGVGDKVFWPLSEADAQRLQKACCGDGTFNGSQEDEQFEKAMNEIREAAK